MYPRRMSHPIALAVFVSMALHMLLWLLIGNESAGIRDRDDGASRGLTFRLDYKNASPAPIVSAVDRAASPPTMQGELDATSAENALRESDAHENWESISSRTLQNGLVQLQSSPFYPSEQLTVRPRVIAEVELETPETKHLAASGDIVLQVLIDDKGEVVGVEVETSSLPEIFSRTVSNAFRRFKFTPGEIGGLAVRSVMRVAISFNDISLPKEAQSQR
jgi:TonB family protein